MYFIVITKYNLDFTEDATRFCKGDRKSAMALYEREINLQNNVLDYITVSKITIKLFSGKKLTHSTVLIPAKYKEQ